MLACRRTIAPACRSRADGQLFQNRSFRERKDDLHSNLREQPFAPNATHLAHTDSRRPSVAVYAVHLYPHCVMHDVRTSCRRHAMLPRCPGSQLPSTAAIRGRSRGTAKPSSADSSQQAANGYGQTNWGSLSLKSPPGVNEQRRRLLHCNEKLARMNKLIQPLYGSGQTDFGLMPKN